MILENQRFLLDSSRFHTLNCALMRKGQPRIHGPSTENSWTSCTLWNSVGIWSIQILWWLEDGEPEIPSFLSCLTHSDTRSVVLNLLNIKFKFFDDENQENSAFLFDWRTRIYDLSCTTSNCSLEFAILWIQIKLDDWSVRNQKFLSFWIVWHTRSTLALSYLWLYSKFKFFDDQKMRNKISFHLCLVRRTRT